MAPHSAPRTRLVPDVLLLPRPPEGHWHVARQGIRFLSRLPDGTGFAAGEAGFRAVWAQSGRPVLVWLQGQALRDLPAVGQAGKPVPAVPELALQGFDLAQGRLPDWRQPSRLVALAAVLVLGFGGYAFARDRGVVLFAESQAPARAHHPVTPALSLIEVLRLTEGKIDFKAMDAEAFSICLAQGDRDNASDASASAGQDGGLAAIADSAAVVDDLLDQSDDSPLIRLIKPLLLEAIREKASDIHIETQEKLLVVCFRIDGELREVLSPRRTLATLLVSRIKIMAQLDIAERRLPQDGRVSLRLRGTRLTCGCRPCRRNMARGW